MLKDKIDIFLKHIESNKSYLRFNKQIFDISEGALIDYVATVIHNQVTRRSSADKMVERIPPINIMNKIVNRISNLYSSDVSRDTNDEDMVNYFQDGLNEDMQEAQKNLNRYKSSCVKLYEDPKTKKIETMPVPSWQVLPFSDDPTDKKRVTAMIELVGAKNNKQVYWIYSEDEFLSIDENGAIVTEDMVENGGINPFGVIPFVYRGVSKNLLIPLPDKDLLQMTVLIPLLMSEINFGAAYLSNPIIYGLNLDLQDSEFNKNPDAIIMLQTDPTKDGTGSLNVLQPNMNIDAQLKLVMEQLNVWLETRDIKAGTVGGGAQATTSGIALMIENMDGTRAVKQQARIFKNIEKELWYKLAVMHNAIVDAGRADNTARFKDDFYLDVSFVENDIPETRSDKVTTQKLEVDARLKSRQTAIKELNPDWDLDRIEVEIQLIDQENSLGI
jgi:hypothetical protein